MLIELFGRNFGSFRDEFHLSMLATDIDPGNPRGVVEVLLEGEDEPLRLLRCAAIYGPNASGKSTVLQAAAALWYMLASSAFMPSDRPLAPFEPFLLDNKSKSEPIKLGIRAVVDARVYEYLVEYDQKKIVLERLTEFAPDQPELLFERREGDVEGPWTNDKQFVLLAESFRSNALLLSLADRLAPKLAKGLATGFGRLLNHHDPTWNRHPSFDAKRAARQASMDRAGFGAWLLGWLKDADVGIVGYETKEMKPADESAGENLGSGPNVREDQEMEFQLFHDGVDGPIGFNCRRESEGTRRIVELAPYIHDLTHGDVNRAYFIDEIGASVHPQLLQALIRHFNCDAPQESVRGQLIFATHETALLDAEAKDAVLRRDQVYLTEKDSSGASRLYSVAEFKERNNLNLRRRYLQGRYGALPALGQFGD